MTTLLAIIIVLPIGFLGAALMFLTITEQDDAQRKYDNLKNTRLAYEATRQFEEKIRNLGKDK